MSLEYNKKNITLAKNLRKNSTPQERRLWYGFLSKHQPRFQRQKAIGDFIVDFYCHKAKLVVEIDGSQHFTLKGEKEDKKRTEVLKSYGLRVVRVTNKQIDTQFECVCEHIGDVVESFLREEGGPTNVGGRRVRN